MRMHRDRFKQLLEESCAIDNAAMDAGIYDRGNYIGHTESSRRKYAGMLNELAKEYQFEVHFAKCGDLVVLDMMDPASLTTTTDSKGNEYVVPILP